MLEFYHRYYPNSFQKKAKFLSDELTSILRSEDIKLESATELNIPEIYKGLLKDDLFANLNDIYFTIRKIDGISHHLLKRYLPEAKCVSSSKHLFADFFCGAGGLSQGLINAGFQPAFVNDISTDALETYYFNHSLPLDRFFNGDIKNLVEDFNAYRQFFKNIN